MKKNILILGANGLLGNNLLNYFLLKSFNPKGVVRNKKKIFLKKNNYFFSGEIIKKNKLNISSLKKIIKTFRPHYIINCIGITKRNLMSSKSTRLINSILPKEILKLNNNKNKFKLIHISTDCVYDGTKGNYKETDLANAKDLYGASKLNGEPNSPDCIVFRTSMIGHNYDKNNGLLEWFLNQKKVVKGYKKMFFSGPTCIEIAKIIERFVIKKEMIKSGTINLGVKRISKFNLLKKISKIYKKKINIMPSSNIKIDRSLNIKKFQSITKYNIQDWDKIILQERKYYNLFKTHNV